LAKQATIYWIENFRSQLKKKFQDHWKESQFNLLTDGKLEIPFTKEETRGQAHKLERIFFE